MEGLEEPAEQDSSAEAESTEDETFEAGVEEGDLSSSEVVEERAALELRSHPWQVNYEAVKRNARISKEDMGGCEAVRSRVMRLSGRRSRAD